jgi:hypothetical protein
MEIPGARKTIASIWLQSHLIRLSKGNISMLSNNSQVLVDSVVSQKVSANALFTAYDVTLEARGRTTERLVHQDVKDRVHELMQNILFMGAYKKELIDVGTPVQPWLYLPVHASSHTYLVSSCPTPTAPSPSVAHRIRAIRQRGQNPDGRGRICVPADYVRQLGLSQGMSAYVSARSGKIKIVSSPQTGYDVQYLVDKDDNIRISSKIVERAALQNKNYKFKVDQDKILVS